ncbi:receptor-type tyrosine-protein phosphatase alpha-like isoform X2 [Ostrea edulis]|nr:receptor-type tyrosine-protein phosphatase alpha-like isoform X2 [Ostrea edulis]XP_048758086.2 receptor-type tyrosine-protein phosphatase alpha-like isoform X2 [Ostrea edulis]XP_048758087.2 receptor-type tyrosine-protein phosphatase alpha-like isoform X2 [Ostrea edulis]
MSTESNSITSPITTASTSTATSVATTGTTSGSMTSVATTGTTSGSMTSVATTGTTSGSITSVATTGTTSGSMATTGTTSGSITSVATTGTTSGSMTSVATTGTTSGSMTSVATTGTTSGSITSVATTGTTSGSMTSVDTTSVESETTASMVSASVTEDKNVTSEITTGESFPTSELQTTFLVSDTTNVAFTVSKSTSTENQETTTGSHTTTTNSEITTSSNQVTSAPSLATTTEDGTASTSGIETSRSQMTTVATTTSFPITTERSVTTPTETTASEVTTTSDVSVSPTDGILTTAISADTPKGSQSTSAELYIVSATSVTSDESLMTETSTYTSTMEQTTSSTIGMSETTASFEKPSESTTMETSSTSLTEETSASSVSVIPSASTSESMTMLSSESTVSASSLTSPQLSLSTTGVISTEVIDTNMTTSEAPSTTSETMKSSESATQLSESTTQVSESTTQSSESTAQPSVSSTVTKTFSVHSTSEEITGLTGATDTSQSTTEVPSSHGSTTQQTEFTSTRQTEVTTSRQTEVTTSRSPTTQITERTTSSGPTSRPTERTTGPTTQQSSQTTTVAYNTTALPPISSTTMGTLPVPTGPNEVSASPLVAILVSSLLVVFLILAVVFSRYLFLKKRNRQKISDEEIASNDIDMVPLTPIHNGTNGVLIKEDLDDSLPYVYDKDGDLIYAGGPQGYPIPVKDIQSHVIKLQEENQFFSDYKSLPDGMFLPTKDSNLDDNMPKNRYTNMLAYDHSRVKLKGLPAGHTDYINANYIDGFKKKKAYIATQGPLKNTTSDFWSMIWQEGVKKIVMVTNLKEKNRVKCFQYWPQEKKFMTCYNLRVTMESEHVFPVFVLRKIKITNTKTDDVRSVTQYHFTAWPDHGVPDAFQLLQFYRKVTGGSTEYDAQPVVVHCSAGVGRTGTYIGLDALWKEGCETGSIDILSFGKIMRKNRTKMIQTLDQYTFLHFILMEAFSNRDAAIPGGMIANFKGMQDPKVTQRINAEFEKLNTLRPKYQTTDYQDALHSDNKSKNRSQLNLAVDNYRARLPSNLVEDSDYINTVIMPSIWNREGYLMTQYPLPSTISDFWSMVLGYQCSSIVLLDDSKDYEENFYPVLQQTSEWGHLVIQTTAVSEPQDCVTETTVTLTNTQDAIDNDEEIENETEMEVKIFTGHGWSSSSELPNVQNLLHCLHYEVQKRQTKLGEQKPVVVICRDGGKQSGLYCAVCNIQDGIDWYNEINIYHNVRQLQIRKPEIITSKNQYQYCYQVAFRYLDSGNVYENHGSTEDEIRESDYANMGEFRSSLKKDPLVKQGAKGQKKGTVDQGGELYANVSDLRVFDDPFDAPSNTELLTTI